jgi:hypothetical protein
MCAAQPNQLTTSANTSINWHSRRRSGGASSQSDSDEWYLGPNERVTGSLHTDIWTGRAAELAQRGLIAVYPVGGWWKERPDRDRGAEGARYSLIVSIETPDVDVDIWTPVAAEIGIPIAVET